MKFFIRNLRILSSVVLFFFLWSFGPLFEIPTAFAAKKQAPGGGQGMGGQNADPGLQEASFYSSGAQFENTLEILRRAINKADEKETSGRDSSAEIAEIIKQKNEIEKIGRQLKDGFTAMEKKLADGGLPREILNRHGEFVKRYEDNLAELEENLREVEHSAISGRQKKEALSKAKLHLEKTKAPSRHQEIDTFKPVKGTPRTPRLKKEDFEKDLSLQSAQRTAELPDADQHPRLNHSGTGFWTRILNSAFRTRNSALASKPLLIAYTGPASDMPLALGGDFTPSTGLRTPNRAFTFPDIAFSPNPELETLNLALASVSDAPTAADLAETPETQISPAIAAKAAELGKNPHLIYEWVRNTIEFTPTYGSIQGADACLESKVCNAYDTASLLIALLRASNVSARYAYGTIEIPAQKYSNWMGGYADVSTAIEAAASADMPVAPVTTGGIITAVRLEHIWAEAWIDYNPSRGARHREGDTWIPLDASYKLRADVPGIDKQHHGP